MSGVAKTFKQFSDDAVTDVKILAKDKDIVTDEDAEFIENKIEEILTETQSGYPVAAIILGLTAALEDFFHESGIVLRSDEFKKELSQHSDNMREALENIVNK